jgi:hypothetical protein
MNKKYRSAFNQNIVKVVLSKQFKLPGVCRYLGNGGACSRNGFDRKPGVIINNLVALVWVCLGLFQSHVIDSMIVIGFVPSFLIFPSIPSSPARFQSFHPGRALNLSVSL